MNTPRKILNIVGLIFFSIVFLFIAIAVWTQYESMEYRETAVPYIKKIVPEISKWDPDTLQEYMMEDAVSDISSEELSRMVNFLSKVGALVSLGEPVFSSVESSSTPDNKRAKFVSYQLLGQYENGEAVVEITLIDHGDTFEVYSFGLSSDALLD